MRLTTSFAVLLILLSGSFANQASAQRADDKQLRPLFGGPVRQKPVSELLRTQDLPRISPRLLKGETSGPIQIVISLSKQRLYFMMNEETLIDSPISSGKRVGMTPTGNFTILEKDPDHRSSVYGAFVDGNGRIVRAGVSTKKDSAPAGTRYAGAPMKYFMRLTNEGVGMHVGILPGYPASHGCVRLPEEVAKLIYQRVEIKQPVTITE
ncbi:unnamed protein product [uncultured bacterium]|nr:unnamed protein product [uncultured bacterium]